MANDDVPLRQFLDQRWQDHTAVHQAEGEARDKALASMDKRLDAMNEFRASLNDVVGQTVSRENYETRHSELDRRIQAIERNMVRQEALDSTTAELARTRRALALTIIGGVVITIVAAAIDAVARIH